MRTHELYDFRPAATFSSSLILAGEGFSLTRYRGAGDYYSALTTSPVVSETTLLQLIVRLVSAEVRPLSADASTTTTYSPPASTWCLS